MFIITLASGTLSQRVTTPMCLRILYKMKMASSAGRPLLYMHLWKNPLQDLNGAIAKSLTQSSFTCCYSTKQNSINVSG